VRLSKDEYFMAIARAVAERATCCRRKVGAVLVVDGHVISTGYNGAPTGMPHCIDVGCEIVNGHCIRCIHAEANALLQAGLIGIATRGATLYTTASPCRNCMGLVINAGIARVVYADLYTDPLHKRHENIWALEAAKMLGIAMERVHEKSNSENFS
jgi:dCMP deaminase